jgi:GAF domain-containing protein
MVEVADDEGVSEEVSLSGRPGIAARIAEISLLASQTGDIDKVLEAVVRRVIQETGAFSGGIALIDHVRHELRHGWAAYADGTPLVIPGRQPVGRGIVGHVATTGKSLVVDDVTTFPDYWELVEGIRSEAAVPLTLDGRVLGVLDVESRELGHFTPRMVAMLDAVAAPVALAMRNAQLFHDERRRAAQLALLYKVGRILTSTIDLDDLSTRRRTRWCCVR